MQPASMSNSKVATIIWWTGCINLPAAGSMSSASVISASIRSPSNHRGRNRASGDIRPVPGALSYPQSRERERASPAHWRWRACRSCTVHRKRGARDGAALRGDANKVVQKNDLVASNPCRLRCRGAHEPRSTDLDIQGRSTGEWRSTPDAWGFG
jgi:hypothetical protein